MKTYKRISRKILWKRIAAITMVLFLLPQAVEPLSASVRDIVTAEEMQMNLLEIGGASISAEKYEHMMLKAEKKGELAAFSLEFSILPNTVVGETEEIEEEISIETTEFPSETEILAETEMVTESITEPITETSSGSSEAQEIMEEETVSVEAPTYEASVSSNVQQGEVQKEEVFLQLAFSDFFFIQEDMKQGEVIYVSDDAGENGKVFGNFNLVQKEDYSIVLEAVMQVPQYREDVWNGKILFYLGFAEKQQAFALQWDEQKGQIDGIDKVLYERTPMKGRLVAATQAASAASESKVTEIDIKSALAKISDEEVKKYAQIYDSAVMKLTTTRGSKKITVAVDAKLSDTFLNDGFEKLLDGYKEGTDFDEYLNNNDNYTSAGLIPLRLPFLFGDTFKTVTGENIQTGLTEENSSHPDSDEFGYYELVNDTAVEGLIRMNCILKNILYTKTNAEMKFSYELECSKDIAFNEIYTFEEKEGKISCGTNEVMVLEGDPTEAEPYKIEKNVLKEDAKSPYVTYQIPVKAYEIGGLDATYLEDILPQFTLNGKDEQALMVNKVFLTTDKESKREITKGETGDRGDKYYIDKDEGKDVLYYYFGKNGNTRAVLEVQMILTPTAMLSMNKNSTVEFENKVSLKKQEDGSEIGQAVSNPVTKQFKMFEKSGKQSETDASKMEWTIKVQALFSGSPKVWLVDTVDPARHAYIGEKITVMEKKIISGAEETTPHTLDLKQITGTGITDNSFAKVSAADLDAYSSANGGAKAFYYTAGDGTLVMAVNIGAYLGSAGQEKVEKKLDITYTTQIKEGVSGADTKISNKADIRWQYAGGEGPGWSPDFQFSLDREETVNLNGVIKRPASAVDAYNPETQIQKWWFDINSVRQEQGELVIEEDFSAEGCEQILLLEADGKSLSYPPSIKHINSGSSVAQGKIPSGSMGSVKPYYEVNGKKLLIYLGNVSANDSYIVELATKVSGKVLANANPDGMNTNTMVLNSAQVYKAGAAENPYNAEASNIVPNTLITKEAIGNYDYEKNELTWKVSVNPNALQIKEGTIIEELPKDMNFGRLTEVNYGTDTITAPEGGSLINTVPASGGSLISADMLPSNSANVTVARKPDSSGGNEVYEISLTSDKGVSKIQLEKPFTFIFTTKLSQAYLDSIFKQETTSDIYSEIKNKGKLSKNHINTARLSGQIMDESTAIGYEIAPASVYAQATNTIVMKPLEKTGSYDKNNPGIVKWSTIINQAKGDIGGLKLLDTLSNPIMEFNTDPSSYGLYEAKVDKDGTVHKGTKITGTSAEPVISPKEHKLSLSFPSGWKETYLLEFETYLLDDAQMKDIQNTLTLMGTDGKGLSSNTATPTGADSFSSSEYARAKNAPVLMLEKYSSSTNEAGQHLIKLAETEFTITEQEYDSSARCWKNKADSDKINETNQNGRRIFVNFQKGKLYKIEETKAPAGYTANVPLYIYWMKDVTADPTVGKEMNDSSGNPIEAKNIIKVDTSYFKKQPIYNEPIAGSDTGNVTFMKCNSDGSLLEGAEFTLTHDKNLTKSQTVVSGIDGIVTFKNVDPGVYTLTETSIPKPYLIQLKPMKVEKTGTDYSIKDSLGIELAKDGGNYIVKNHIADANIKVEKKDQNGKLLKDVVFLLYRYGDASTPEPDVSLTSYVPYPDSDNTARTNTSGIADFGKLIYGTYKITETLHSDALPEQTQNWYLEVTCENHVPKVIWHKDDPKGATPSKGNVMTAKPDGSYLSAITNRLKYGYIQLKKVAGTKDTAGSLVIAKDAGNMIPVEGAVFEIFIKTQGTLSGSKWQINSNEKPFLTLKTNREGEFVHNADGTYTDAFDSTKKVNLLTGDYLIREKSSPTGYLTDKNVYEIKAAWDESANEPKTAVFGNIQEEGISYFVNEMCRAQVKLNKVDADNPNQSLSGAEFVVYDEADDCAVAVLEETVQGQYSISDAVIEGVTVVTKNAQGLNYIKQNADGKWELLAGNYYLKEITPPAGYEPLTSKTAFTIDSAAEVILKNPESNSNFTNQRGKRSITLQKEVNVGTANNVPATQDQKRQDGFSFQLEGNPEMAGETFTTQTQVTNADGKIEWKEIPYGTYIITEQERALGDSRKGIYKLAEPITVVISKDGILADKKEVSETAGVYTLPVSNLLKRGSITGEIKAFIGTEEVFEEGVKVGIFEDASATVPVKDKNGTTLTAISDKNGKFIFTDMPYGTYYIKELEVPETVKMDAAILEVVLCKDTNGASASPSQPFKNELWKLRAGLDKKDSIDIKGAGLSGAVFCVYGKEAPMENETVAYLTEAADGTYRLSNELEGKKLPKVLGKEKLPCYVEINGTGHLTSGSYYVKETTAPQYYQKDTNIYPIKVDKASDDTEVKLTNILNNQDGIFTNTRIPSDVVLRKIYKVKDVDGSEVKYGLGEAEFSVYTDEACTLPYKVEIEGIKTALVVNSDIGSASKMPGEIMLKGLPPGTYFLKETKVPNYFEQSKQPIYKVITDGNRTETKVTLVGDTTDTPLTELENKPEQTILDTYLEVNLRGIDGKILANATFQVYRNGVLVTTVTTNSLGKFRMRGILPGAYTIRQITSAEDYKPDEVKKDITVNLGDNKEVQVINYREDQKNNSGGGGNSLSTATISKAVKKENIKEEQLLQVLPKTGGMTGNILLIILSAGMILTGYCQRKRGKKNNTLFLIGAGILLAVIVIVPLCLEYRTEKILLNTLSEQIASEGNISDKEQPQAANTDKQKEAASAKEQEKKGIGILSIPKIELEVPIREGVESKDLKAAVGHVPGSAFPGESIGNCAIAGHRNYSFGRFFNRLEEVENGDMIMLTSAEGKTYYYEVNKTMIVEPEQIEVLEQGEEEELTLITCTPMYLATHRFIVKATPLGTVLSGEKIDVIGK